MERHPCHSASMAVQTHCSRVSQQRAGLSGSWRVNSMSSSSPSRLAGSVEKPLALSDQWLHGDLQGPGLSSW